MGNRRYSHDSEDENGRPTRAVTPELIQALGLANATIHDDVTYHKLLQLGDVARGAAAAARAAFAARFPPKAPQPLPPAPGECGSRSAAAGGSRSAAANGGSGSAPGISKSGSGGGRQEGRDQAALTPAPMHLEAGRGGRECCDHCGVDASLQEQFEAYDAGDPALGCEASLQHYQLHLQGDPLWEAILDANTQQASQELKDPQLRPSRGVLSALAEAEQKDTAKLQAVAQAEAMGLHIQRFSIDMEFFNQDTGSNPWEVALCDGFGGVQYFKQLLAPRLEGELACAMHLGT